MELKCCWVGKLLGDGNRRADEHAQASPMFDVGRETKAPRPPWRKMSQKTIGCFAGLSRYPHAVRL